MSNNNSSTKQIQLCLQKLPGVEQIDEIKIKDSIIQYITIQYKRMGKLVVNRLQIEDSQQLFNFYFQDLSEKARFFFPPYPLFSPQPNNQVELANRISEWKKENDWTVLKLLHHGQITGVCLLKKYKTQPTSGLAVKERFQKKGLGILLQTIINEQARLLGITKLTVTIAPDNVASIIVHQKVGFKKTGKLIPHFAYIDGVKKVDREDVEMIKIFNY